MPWQEEGVVGVESQVGKVVGRAQRLLCPAPARVPRGGPGCGPQGRGAQVWGWGVRGEEGH